MIPSVPSLLPQTGRFSQTAGAHAVMAGNAGAASFAALLTGAGSDAGETAPADDAPATDRHDDAAAGTALPAGSTATAVDPGWLALVFTGSGAGATATLPVATAASGFAAPADTSPPTAAPLPPVGSTPAGIASPRPAAVTAMTMSTRLARQDNAQPSSPAASVPTALPSVVDPNEAAVTPLPIDEPDDPPMVSDAPVVPPPNGAPLAVTPANPLAAASAGTVLPSLPEAVASPSRVAADGVVTRRSVTPAASYGSPSAALSIAPRAASSAAAMTAPLRFELDRGSAVASLPPVATAVAASLPSAATVAVTPGAPAEIPTANVASEVALAATVAAPREVAAAPRVAEAAGTKASPVDGVPRATVIAARPASGQPPVPVATVPVPAAPSGPAAFPASSVAPAGEVFAAAIHAAGRRSPQEASDSTTSTAVVLALATTPAAGTVVATGHGGGASLDMRQGGWPSAMVDHIEKLRDAADATDTRIRLVPDALGSIDVSLARRDDGVSVTLTADRPATQAMLAEARPHLADMAEARGIRLADATSASAGSGLANAFAGGQQRQSPAPPPASMPVAAAAATAITDDLDPADGRVA